MKLPWRRGEQGNSPGSGDSGLPPPGPGPFTQQATARGTAGEPDESDLVERPPSLLRRVGNSLAETRRRVLPLPDEVIDQYLGHGERMIHNDHPSFRSFMVENSLLFIGLLVAGVLFLAITFNGSLAGAAVLLLILSIVLLSLVLKRLGDRYTSYVITDTRIMRISGIVSRRAHSIPWVRVTDLTIEQSLAGRFWGYATMHIESANEDSGLRDLDGVSDPLQFNQYVVDMVVAKQGATAPVWELRGEPAPIASERGLRRIRSSRRRRGDRDDTTPAGGRAAAPARGQRRRQDRHRGQGHGRSDRRRRHRRHAAEEHRRAADPPAGVRERARAHPFAAGDLRRPGRGRRRPRRARPRGAGPRPARGRGPRPALAEVARGRAPRHPHGQVRARALRSASRSHASRYSVTSRCTTSAVRSTRFICPTTWPTGLKFTSRAASG